MYIDLQRSAIINDHHQLASSMRALKCLPTQRVYCFLVRLVVGGTKIMHQHFICVYFDIEIWHTLIFFLRPPPLPPPAQLQCVVYVLSSHTTECTAIDKLEKLVRSALIFFQYVV